jgi:D-3-phosphoglycerate dehydrogenase
MKVLIADRVSPTCVEVLHRAGLETEDRPGLKGPDLLRAVADVEGIVVRSDTRITEEVMATSMSRRPHVGASW